MLQVCEKCGVLLAWPFLAELWLHGGEVVDLLVTNGTIYTSDAAFPFADSMAIRGGRILRVGNYSSVKVHFLNLLVYQSVPIFFSFFSQDVFF